MFTSKEYEVDFNSSDPVSLLKFLYSICSEVPLSVNPVYLTLNDSVIYSFNDGSYDSFCRLLDLFIHNQVGKLYNYLVSFCSNNTIYISKIVIREHNVYKGSYEVAMFGNSECRLSYSSLDSIIKMLG